MHTLLSKPHNLPRKYFGKIFFNKKTYYIENIKHIWSSQNYADMLFSPSDQYYFIYTLFRNMHLNASRAHGGKTRIVFPVVDYNYT